ncbi:MAG: GGDEF domain-containing protein [Sulfuritalea sp.]|jgi:diguanylate cyclase|nr:GGDEF domain-containing protein [Sulfuritalea sp.]
MTKLKQPSVIAREALKQLSLRKLAPTPANYQACYNEIANLPNVAGFPEAPLHQISAALTANTPDQEKQIGLLNSAIVRRNWRDVQEALVAFTSSGHSGNGGNAGAPKADNAAPVMSIRFMTNLAHAIENLLPALGDDDAIFSAQVTEFLQALRNPSVGISGVEVMLASFSHRVLIAAEDQAEIKAMLLKLLHLIIENIGELSIDDNWLKGQIDALLVAVMPPLTLRRLDDVERRIRDVMAKQTEAKVRSMEAQTEMRIMLSTFVDQLSMMNKSSSVFGNRLEESARQIEEVKTIEDMTPLLKDVIDTTRAMAEDTRTAHEKLHTLQEKALVTERELTKLHLDLDHASALARHDPLTDALNRKGLDEALSREIADVRRKETPLSIALLDIDNFKALNDRLGHETGDAALIHLVKVARECMRPVDSLARYGGEEFVILMPDTPLGLGIQTMTRLQRKLTTTFFLTGNEKVLITFSAGVAQMTPMETSAEAIKRADKAMYLAKRAGKNRVLGG